MRPDVPHFIILLSLMPDDFTRQGESAATQWVNNIHVERTKENKTVHEELTYLIQKPVHLDKL